MLTEEEKYELLERLKKTIISDEHWEMVDERIKLENKEYERIAKAQTLSYDEWHRPFDL